MTFKLFIFVLIHFFLSNVYSQNLVLFDSSGSVIENKDTIEVFGNSSDHLIHKSILINNVDLVEKNIKVKKETIYMSLGSLNTFCFGDLCYGGLLQISSSPVNLAPGVINNTFYTELYPNNMAGISLINYCFYDELEMDSVSVYVKFVISETNFVDNNAISVKFTKVYPNPGTDYMSICSDVELKSVAIFNSDRCLMKNVENHLFNDACLQIDVSEWPTGIYFLQTLDGQNRPGFETWMKQ